MLRFNTLLIALCVVAATFGCSKDEKKPPPAPGGNGFQAAGTGSRRDGGPKDSGGPTDASFSVDASTITGECASVDPGAYVNGGIASDGTVLTGVTSPSDLMITRSVATWGTSCLDPTIVIELSDGKCPDGKQHELQLQLSANAIDGTAATPTILIGQNVVQAVPEDTGIRVQYVRPKSLTPHGTWGSCTGMPGSVSFISEPTTARLGRLTGSFTLALPACDGTDKTDEFVNGTFNVILRRGREDVCPGK